MDDLIEALQIFRKYGNPNYPTCCEHDELYVMIEVDLVSPEDIKALENLGFSPNDVEGFSSFRFGSA